MFPHELESKAFKAGDEFGWTRAQIPEVVDILSSHAMGILGGELWWISEAGWFQSVPQRQGGPGIYTWVTERRDAEAWQDFVERGASDALAATEQWPKPEDLPPNLTGRILYNLTWVSEAEFEALRKKKRKMRLESRISRNLASGPNRSFRESRVSGPVSI